MADGNESPHRRQSQSVVALVFSAASLLLASPAVFQGIRLLKEARPQTHTTLLFRGTAIPCLVCALLGLFLGTRSGGARFATTAVIMAAVAIVAVLLIALVQ